MQLLADGISIPIAQMGPDFVLLRQPISLPPGDATLVFRVDQAEKRWLVHLPNGVAGSKRVVIAPCRLND
jgi:hypothetical protein